MTQRITSIEPAHAGKQAAELLSAVQAKLGVTPNLMKTLANSPAALEGYLSLNAALSKGLLPPSTREQIAIAVAQENRCEYCLAAHSFLGKEAGLSAEQILAARTGQATNDKSRAALELAAQVLKSRGAITDQQLATARAAGITHGEIAEVVAHVALNVFTNYFNVLAQTEVDFPPVSLSL